MTYILKSGALRPVGYDNTLAKIKSDFRGQRKNIYLPDGILSLCTDIIRIANAEDGINYTQYIMYTPQGEQISSGWSRCPGCKETASDVLSNTSKVNHIFVVMNNVDYVLNRVSRQLYELCDDYGKVIMKIKHRGIQGGWYIETFSPFKPDIICGIFCFCRYLEQENEFMII